MTTGAGGFDEAQLLLHAAWMRRLAASLVGNRGGAEDAAQEAALAALQRPPPHELNVSGWLGQVVRNAARRLARAEKRRVQREARVARPEALPSTDELAAQAELQRELSGALLALKEPYRSTLVLRFYHDMEPAEIARREGVPPATVRSRLLRGLEQLRMRLDARCGGREAWSAVLAPLARVSPSTSGGNAGPGAAALALGAAGWLALGAKVALGCALAAAVAGALYVGFSGSPERLEGELGALRPSEAKGLATPTGVGADERGLAPPAVEGERVALETSPAARASATVRVVARRPDGTPVAGASIEAFPYGTNDPLVALAVTDAQGRAELAAPPGDVGRVRLAWGAPGLMGGHHDFDDLEDELDLGFRWTANLTGVVRDAETGEPLEGVEVLDAPPAAVTDPDGRYLLSGLPVGQSVHLQMHKEGYAGGDATFFLREPGEALLDLALERGFPFELAFFDRDTGLPLADVRVARGLSLGLPPFARSGDGGTVGLRAAVGSKLSVTATAEGYSPWTWTWNVQAEPPQGLARVPLVKHALIEGRVTGEGGQPVEGAFLSAECDEHGSEVRFSLEQRTELGLPGSCAYWMPAVSNVRSDALGNYRLPVVPCGHVLRLRAGRGAFAGARFLLQRPLEPGEDVRADVELAHGATIRGRVMENGEPLAGARVSWKGALGNVRDSARCDADGRYELAQVASGAVTVALYAQGGSEPLEVAHVEVEPGQVLDRDFTRTLAVAEIRGSVRGPGGPVAGASVTASLTSAEGAVRRTFHASTDGDGLYDLSVAADGLYELQVSTLSLSGSRSRVPAGATGVDFDLRAPGMLRLRLVDGRTEAPLRFARKVIGLHWRRAGEEGWFQNVALDPDVDGRQDLSVGVGLVDVLVHAADEGYSPRLVEALRVPAGGASEIVTVALEPGCEARLVFRGEGVAPVDLRGHLLFLVEQAELDLIEGPLAEGGGPSAYNFDGVWLRLSSPALLGQWVRLGTDGAARVPGLAPGRYHLRVYPDDFVFEPAVIELPAASAEPIAVRWRRR